MRLVTYVLHVIEKTFIYIKLVFFMLVYLKAVIFLKKGFIQLCFKE